MTSVELRPLPLPPSPPEYDTWHKDCPQYLSAYNLAFNAERYATQKLVADSTTNDNIISARVAGYLLVELFNWREILTTRPCDQLSKEIQSESQESGGSVNGVVYKVGKFYRDRFIRLCAFHFTYVIRCLNFLAVRTTTTTYPTPSLHPSPPSFDTLDDMNRDCMMADGTDYQTARRKVRIPIHYAFPSYLRLGSCPRWPSLPIDRQLQPEICGGLSRNI